MENSPPIQDQDQNPGVSLSDRIENFLFRRVPMWLVGVLLAFAALAMIAFGNIAVHAFKGGTKAGVVGDVVLRLSTLPALVKRMRNADTYLHLTPDPFPGQGGFDFRAPPGARPDAGFLLLSRYDGDDMRSYVELWDLNAQEMLHQWAPPIDEINAAANLASEEVNLRVDKAMKRLILRHPAVMDNGDIIIKSRTPISRIDMCNRVVWTNDTTLFHHALETDAEGNLWTATRIEPSKVPYTDPVHFYDDAITQLSPDGKIMMQRSVAQILIDNGLERYVYGRGDYHDNPIHLNDIQPTETSGPYWNKGDLFLSLRSHSLILLYRPDTNKILWFQEGPWSHQHDVDILDDHRISVFDNAMLKAWPVHFVPKNSTIRVFDFETGTTTAPWDDALAKLDFHTVSEGLHRIRANGDLFVEEQNRARILELDPSGTPIWTYVNRAENGEVYRVGWSRFLEPDEAAPIVAALKAGHCG